MVSKGGKFALRIINYIFALGEAIAPSIFTFRRIVAQNSVGSNTCIPYELIWFNALVQFGYAMRKDDMWPIVVYGIILTITTAYCFAYLWYSTTQDYRTLAWVFLVGKVGFTCVLVLVDFGFFTNGRNKEKRDELHNVMTLVVNVLMYLSPATEVVNAFNTHEIGGLDILLSIAFLGNGIVSTISACLPFSYPDFICGVFGIACSVGQCIVWIRCFYHEHHGAHAHPLLLWFELVGLAV